MSASLASAPELQKKARSSPESCEQLFGQRNLRLAVEDVGDVPQLVQLGLHRRRNVRVAVPEGQRGDAAQQVQVLAPVGVPDARPLPPLQHHRLLLVVLEKVDAGPLHPRLAADGGWALHGGGGGQRVEHGEDSSKGRRQRIYLERSSSSTTAASRCLT